MEDIDHSITLYWSIASQPSRSVKSLLLAGQVPHNTVNIDLLKGEHLQEPFKKVNPRCMIPFIKDNDFGLSESNSILKYLCNTNPSIPEYYWPKDDQTRALTDQYLEFYQFHFRPALIGPLRLRMGKVMGRPFSEAAMDEALANLYASLDTFELMLARHAGAFLVNDKPTIADL